jgi:ATP-dependent protease HslVU (ClpYQ) ATPase subunit
VVGQLARPERLLPELGDRFPALRRVEIREMTGRLRPAGCIEHEGQ